MLMSVHGLYDGVVAKSVLSPALPLPSLLSCLCLYITRFDSTTCHSAFLAPRYSVYVSAA